MKKFALLTNYSKDKRLVYTRMIKTYIVENGGSYWIPRYISEPDKDGDQRYDFSDMPEDIECVLVLGGDGTLKITIQRRGETADSTPHSRRI